MPESNYIDCKNCIYFGVCQTFYSECRYDNELDENYIEMEDDQYWA